MRAFCSACGWRPTCFLADGLATGIKEFSESVSGSPERLWYLSNVEIGRDRLTGVAERPLNHDQFLSRVNHQRALGVPEIVHPDLRDALAVRELAP